MFSKGTFSFTCLISALMLVFYSLPLREKLQHLLNSWLCKMKLQVHQILDQSCDEHHMLWHLPNILLLLWLPSLLHSPSSPLSYFQ
ncbi:hypothetical protein VIGAN_01041400 [Vigna angularis var. angularis]|uniref:Uncharacterized protein n=1 Tax=Vigna angularis var. angularis TaxID=157739 RepID=A0A0S3QXA0_PHAAN|nr:hypothetical protein VIGAN_01041400 [Vigna angularis var. angularis]